MNPLHVTILNLVRSGVTGEACFVESDQDWDSIFNTAEYHGVISLIYRGIRISKPDVPVDILTRFRAGFMEDIRLNRLQMSELKTLFERFDREGIDYLPLKGVVMKQYYPSPEYRWMSDADIVIRNEQYSQISKVLNDLGFSFSSKSEFEYVWIKSRFIIGFHKLIVDPKFVKYSSYIGNPFAHSFLHSDTHCYQLDPTTDMIYSVSHFAKHYIYGGTRLRSLIDFYYLFKFWDYNEEMLKNALIDLGIYKFYLIMKQTISEWFLNKPINPEGEVMLNTVFSESALFKSNRTFIYEAANESRGGEKNSLRVRLKTLFKRFFLPYDYMAKRFRILKKAPFLLPFFWIWRGIEALFFRRKRLKRIIDIQYSNSAEYVKDYMDELKIFGLDDAVIPEDF